MSLLESRAARADGAAPGGCHRYFEEYLPGVQRTVFHTKKGLSWRNAWGVMRYAANNAFLCFVHSQHLMEQVCLPAPCCGCSCLPHGVPCNCLWPRQQPAGCLVAQANGRACCGLLFPADGSVHFLHSPALLLSPPHAPNVREGAYLTAPLAFCLQGDKQFAAKLFTYGQQQVNYMLGDAGRSYVVGFGKDPPNMPFHKWSLNAYIDYPTRGKKYDLQHDEFHNSNKVRLVV